MINDIEYRNGTGQVRVGKMCVRVCSCVVKLVTVNLHVMRKDMKKMRKLIQLEIIFTQKELLKCRC